VQIGNYFAVILKLQGVTEGSGDRLITIFTPPQMLSSGLSRQNPELSGLRSTTSNSAWQLKSLLFSLCQRERTAKW